MSNLIVTVHNDILVVGFHPQGIDTATLFNSINQELTQLVRQTPYRRVLLNLENLAHLTSEIIGQIISVANLCKSHNIDFRVYNANAEIRQVFDIMRIDVLMRVIPKGDDPFASFDDGVARTGPRESVNVDDLATAADKGDAAAMVKLGDVYANGSYEEQDPKVAYGWYHKAAKAGDALGQYRTGFCNTFGMGVAVDLEEATEWFLLAAEQEHAESQYMVGVIHCYGLLGDVDEKKAEQWYKRSLANGCSKAETELNRWK